MMQRSVCVLYLFVLLEVASAQNGFLRVLVRDESGRPMQSIVRFLPQTYDFCNPWDALTISQWYNLFLTYAQELGREPNLQEWRDWIVRMGIIAREWLETITDKRGELVHSLHPNIYSVYAWSPGYGIGCAHHVLVRPEETAEVILTLPRVPITMLRAKLVLPSPSINFVSLKFERNGAISPLTYLLSEFVQFPLAQWHPRSKNLPSLGEFIAIFEADKMEARKSFRVERWGELVDLGTIDFKPQPPEPATAKIPVTVQVFWSDGKTPAEGVAVKWMNVKTDNQGRVQIEMPVGGQEVQIWVPKEFWDKGISSFHWVYITPITREVSITLAKPAKVQGFVRYEDGTPVVDAEVEMEMLVNEVRVLGEPRLRELTDKRGAFAFPYVPPGEFELKVRKLVGNQFLFLGTSRYLTVKEGDSIQLTLTLRRSPTRELVGEIKTSSDKPAVGAGIFMLGKTLFTASQGRFKMLHYPTEESIFISLPGEGSIWRWLTILPSKEPMPLSLTLENGIVTGQVVDEKRLPIPKAVVRLKRDGFYFTGLLASHTDNEGKFVITQVPSGQWNLVIDGPVSNYPYPLPALVRSVSVQKNEAVNVGVLRISTKTGGIIGRIVFPSDFGKQQGEKGVKIYLQPQDWSLQDTFIEVSPSKPEFRCLSLPPGTYWLLAKGSGWVSEPQKVVIPGNGSLISVTLLLQRAGRLKVKVRDAKTQEPITASVRVIDANGLELAYGLADCEGEVTLKNILPGSHTLQVWRGLYHSSRVPVIIKTTKTTMVNITLEPKT